MKKFFLEGEINFSFKQFSEEFPRRVVDVEVKVPKGSTLLVAEINYNDNLIALDLNFSTGLKIVVPVERFSSLIDLGTIKENKENFSQNEVKAIMNFCSRMNTSFDIVIKDINKGILVFSPWTKGELALVFNSPNGL